MVKRKRKKSRELPQLPEGVFGVLDDLTPAFKLERLHETPWERERSEARKDKLSKAKAKKRKRKKTRPADMSSRLVPGLKINEEYVDEDLPDVEFENTVEVSESLLSRMQKKTASRTRDISHLLMSRIMPSFLGLEAAQTYTTSAMRDALDVEIEIDDSVTEAAKTLASLDLVFYLVRRSTLPKSFKRQYLRTVVEETARQTVKAITDKAADKTTQKRLADFNAMVVSRQRGVMQAEDAQRRGQNPRTRPREEDVPFSESLLGLEGRNGPPDPDPRTTPFRPQKRRTGRP